MPRDLNQGAGGPSPSPGHVAYPKLPQRLEEHLANTLNRRVSLPSRSASRITEDAVSIHNVVTRDQLQHLAETNPEEFLAGLNELREQRDLGVEATQLYDDMLDKNPGYKDRYEAEKRKKNEAREALQASQDEAVQLKSQVQELQTQLRSRRDGTPSSVQVQTGRRSGKMPHPPMLDDGTDPTWDDWISKMTNKLEINYDHYESEQSRIAYVHSRTQGKAAKIVYARTHRLTTNPYRTVEEILTDLEESFDDPDREGNYVREFRVLTQGQQQRFVEFFMDFRRLATHLELSDKMMIHDLKEKIQPRLRSAWANSGADLDTVSKLRSYLTKVDNEHRAMKEIKVTKEKEVSKEANRSKASKQVTFAVTPRDSYQNRRQSPNPEQRRKALEDQKDGSCYICHKPGHLAANCPDRPSSRPPLRVNEIDVHTDSHVDEDSVDSEQSESENE